MVRWSLPTSLCSCKAVKKRYGPQRSSHTLARKPRIFSTGVGAEATHNGINALVVGGGGREHALCDALQQCESLNSVVCAPGNAGIPWSDAAGTSATDAKGLRSLVQSRSIDVVIVGPEEPLVLGIADALRSSAGVPVLGPSAAAATLEGSKAFLKDVMYAAGVPTAEGSSFDNAEHAKTFAHDRNGRVAVKQDGLAAGKGVVVCSNSDDADEAIDAALANSPRIVVEDAIVGEEVSFFALVDGENAVPLGSSQDHKPVGDGEMGMNTGGMGAISPCSLMDASLEAQAMEEVVFPTAKEMVRRGTPFNGVLFAGLIVEYNTGQVYVLEHNVRFGDPEAQVLLPRLKGDFAQSMLLAAQGRLEQVDVQPERSQHAAGVVLCSEGYPGAYEKGKVVRGISDAELVPRARVYHSGTAWSGNNGEVVTAGGRVLTVVGTGSSARSARDIAYTAASSISFDGCFCRSDIGWHELAREEHAAAEGE